MLISPRVDQVMKASQKSMRLGIMGGTFDPIHFGHLICAEQAREQFGLDYVVFMPTGNPAFKVGRKVSSAEDRYNMVVIATRKNPKFDVSRMEVDREGVTYTYDTLREFNEKTPPGTEIYFITGADAIISVLKWKNAREMLQMAHFIAATRPGYDYSDVREEIESDPEMASRVSFFEVPGLAISSTDLRRRVSEGKSITYLTPVSVAKYIRSHRLYVPSTTE
ncbi:MAG: nicotinate-nucleotide adenylyltransferase, partial [Coriobacteriales bacterium]